MVEVEATGFLNRTPVVSPSLPGFRPVRVRQVGEPEQVRVAESGQAQAQAPDWESVLALGWELVLAPDWESALFPVKDQG